jgi:hypothetical protein
MIYGNVKGRSDRSRRFSESVHGALFFGVPNQGMETAALEKVVREQPNLSLVVSLQKDSDLVTKQSLEFNTVIHSQDLDMIYFYEDQQSTQLAKVSLRPDMHYLVFKPRSSLLCALVWQC